MQLDPNTTVTLAEYIPDFFIRDNQIFKRSDDPVNPAFRLQVKNTATGEEAKLWMFPAYNAGGARREDQLQLRVSRYADGLLHRPGSFARAGTMAGLGRRAC